MLKFWESARFSELRIEKRIIGSEKNLLSADNIHGKPINIGIIQKWRCGSIKICVFQGILHLTFKKVIKKDTASPVSKNYFIFRKRYNITSTKGEIIRAM